MITIDSVTKVYSSKSPPAVENLSLEMKNGEILGLVGLNGAGKTTTIRMSSGIILPTSGSISVDGHDVVKEKVEAAKSIGWIPEFPNFEPNAKPLFLMRYYAGFYGLNKEETEDRIERLLDMVGLKSHLNKKLRNYSQGMKKRFAIAESLIGDPQNVLFDETLNGLDPEGVLFVRNLMLEMRKNGKAVLLSSHILSEVEDVADRVAIINRGKLVKLLTRGELRTLGRIVVHISLANPDEGVRGLLKEFGDVQKERDEIVVTDLTIGQEKIPDIAAALVRGGYRIMRFDPVGESLEEYFFGVIGGKR
ncbi:MAG TPA: ABC transporter ATP-binding protein [Thermoplasmataceae archaeon]|nr:ABC transporter ATP-binding protein [Thermoplasmatales archaeon AK]HLH86561.1 ABC transporter ATP-binding protein [Thermoplasmataceae archaeon]